MTNSIPDPPMFAETLREECLTFIPNQSENCGKFLFTEIETAEYKAK